MRPREQNLPRVAFFGTGQPQRDFVYAGDVAAVVPRFITDYESSDPVNISTQTETSIRDMAAMIGQLTGYRGEIFWDTSHPDGQMVKIYDATRLHRLGMRCSTPLIDGLQRTIQWFEAHRHADQVRL